MSQPTSIEPVPLDVFNNLLGAKADARIDQGQPASIVNEIAVAIEQMTQSELLRSDEVNTRSDLHKNAHQPGP
jgi:hypothetical protein